MHIYVEFYTFYFPECFVQSVATCTGHVQLISLPIDLDALNTLTSRGYERPLLPLPAVALPPSPNTQDAGEHFLFHDFLPAFESSGRMSFLEKIGIINRPFDPEALL